MLHLFFPILLTVLAGSYSLTAAPTAPRQRRRRRSLLASVPASATSRRWSSSDLFAKARSDCRKGIRRVVLYGGSALAQPPRVRCSWSGTRGSGGWPVTIPGAGTGVLSSADRDGAATVRRSERRPHVDRDESYSDSPMVGGLLAYRGHLYQSAYCITTAPPDRRAHSSPNRPERRQRH